MKSPTKNLDTLRQAIDEAKFIVRKHRNTPMKDIPREDLEAFGFAYVILQGAFNDKVKFQSFLRGIEYEAR